MRKIWKLAFVGFAITAFTACGNNENTTDTETTEQVETDMEGDLEMESDPAIIQDTSINNDFADDIPDEQPPIQ
jgi:hypothetical protein